jgi:hypothetical protein
LRPKPMHDKAEIGARAALGLRPLRRSGLAEARRPRQRQDVKVELPGRAPTARLKTPPVRRAGPRIRTCVLRRGVGAIVENAAAPLRISLRRSGRKDSSRQGESQSESAEFRAFASRPPDGSQGRTILQAGA